MTKRSKFVAVCEPCGKFIAHRAESEAKDWCIAHLQSVVHSATSASAQSAPVVRIYYLSTADVVQAIHDRFGGILGV